MVVIRRAVRTPIRDHHRVASLPNAAVGDSGGRPGRSCSLVLGLALALAPLPGTARASSEPPIEPGDQDPQLDQAMRAYERGTQNYNLAQYEAALADFQEAATLYASPDFQYNIGLCYEKLGKPDDAIRAFVTYLKTKPNAEDRPNVENRIKELQDKIERNKRDDDAAQATPVTNPDEGGDEVEPVVEEPAEPEKAGRPLILAGVALVGVGATVALGGGIGFGVLARQRSLSLDEVQSEGNPEELTFSDAEALEDEGRRFEAIQIGMAAGGAALGITGAVLLALGLRKRKAVQASAAWLGPSTVGLSLQGRF